MKKIILFATAVALFTFNSCQKEASVNDQKIDLVFTGTIGHDTKTTINAQSGVVAWEDGDMITITDGAGTVSKYTIKFIDAQGKATFVKVDGQPILGDGPYSAVYGIDPADDQTFSTTVPSLPMSALSDSTNLTFTVSCGLLELTLKAADDETVKNVSKIEVLGIPEGGTQTVYKLKCDTPKSIASETVFYLAVPAGKYSVYVTNDDYYCDTIKVSSPLVVKANTILARTNSGIRFRYAKDICFNIYSTVTINNVIWMKENFMCDKYDTESEVYSYDPDYYFSKNNYTIPKSQPSTPTFKDTARTPYYTDARDKEHTWSRRTAAKKQQTSLTAAQIAKMGYLYSWAAAVGVATDLLRTTDFTGNRQGICPNGWHVPSQAEVDALKAYIEQQKGTDTAGSHLKSTSGWYNAGNPSKYPQGVDTYGFDLLPAGFAAGDSVSNVGAAGHILSSSPSGSRSYKFYYAYGSYTNAKLPCSDGAPKCNGRSLRCIKNK